jgi:hypothetical protein
MRSAGIMLLLSFIAASRGFMMQRGSKGLSFSKARQAREPTASCLFGKLTKERREILGVGDDEDEYDLYKALENNTDPFISKLIAGSFIIVMIALLTAGVIVPSLADYGEGVCNPIVTQGRC